MLLNSMKKNTQQKRSIKLKSNKRNNKNIIKMHEKPQNYISKFQFNPLNKKKNNKIMVNKIFKNNKIIEYSPLSNNTLNLFKDGKSSENLEQNSTFIFTGDIDNYDENNQIIDKYLKKSNVQSIFDCKSISISTISIKEDYEITFSKENSFSINSSKTSFHSKKSSTKRKENNNQKLMSILKKINSSSDTIENGKNNNIQKKQKYSDKKNNDNNIFNKIIPQKLEEKKVKKEINTKKKKFKKIYFVLFIVINIIFYVVLIMKLFEPSVERLFYDNDHENYIYTISLLSQDRSIVVNK